MFWQQAARVGVVERRDVLVVLRDGPHPLALLLFYKTPVNTRQTRDAKWGTAKKNHVFKKKAIATGRKLSQKQKKNM